MKQWSILFADLPGGKGQESESTILKTDRSFSSYKISGKCLVLKMEESSLFAHQEIN